jgi:hypothetical protein
LLELRPSSVLGCTDEALSALLQTAVAHWDGNQFSENVMSRKAVLLSTLLLCSSACTKPEELPPGWTDLGVNGDGDRGAVQLGPQPQTVWLLIILHGGGAINGLNKIDCAVKTITLLQIDGYAPQDYLPEHVLPGTFSAQAFAFVCHDDSLL